MKDNNNLILIRKTKIDSCPTSIPIGDSIKKSSSFKNTSDDKDETYTITSNKKSTEENFIIYVDNKILPLNKSNYHCIMKDIDYK